MSDAAHGGRRAARERALSLLYEADTKEQPVSVVVAEQPAPPDAFAVEVASGVQGDLATLDDLIARYARGWTLARMPLLDLTVLRMATFELVHRPDVPTAAVISEAVELAKRFSTDNSSRFVNGVLASIAAEVRAAAGPAGRAEG